ncbi:MAG: hypothetical protein HZC48_06680 [Nitrospirae bacterium]|nr:hypothetical protein [Nitrospirota bacterium]
MKKIIKLFFLNDRRSIILLSAIAVVIIITITVSIKSRDARKRNDSLKAQLTELESLGTGLIEMKEIVNAKERKIGLTKESGVVSRLESILKTIGLEARALKPMQVKRINELIEEDAELEIQNIDLNGIVNLMYQINNAPAPMKIKSASIKSTFEDPDKFILKLTASLISRE